MNPKIPVFFLLALFSTQNVYAECTTDQIIKLGDQGWFPKEIKQMCGGSGTRPQTRPQSSGIPENVNQQDAHGYTALMNAVMAGDKEKVKSLLAEGADVSLKNKKGMTAMDIAKFKNYREIMKMLMGNPVKCDNGMSCVCLGFKMEIQNYQKEIDELDMKNPAHRSSAQAYREEIQYRQNWVNTNCS